MLKSLLCNFEAFWTVFYKYFTGKGVVYEEPHEYIYELPHLIVIGLAIVVTVVVYFLLRRRTYETQRKFLVATAITLAVCEIFTRMSKLLYFADLGQLDLVMAIKVILPIHFCQIMVWVIIVAILIDNKPMITFSALCGLLASLFYLAYPIEGLSASFLHVRAFNSIFTHSLAFVASINMMLLGMVKFKLKDFKITIGFLLCIVAYGFIMNLVFPGENYMFMIENPTSLTFGPVPYQLVFALLILAFLSVFYLVPHWIEKRKMKKS